MILTALIVECNYNIIRHMPINGQTVCASSIQDPPVRQRVAVALSHSFCSLPSVAGAEEATNGQKMLGQNVDLVVLSTAMAAPTLK